LFLNDDNASAEIAVFSYKDAILEELLARPERLAETTCRRSILSLVSCLGHVDLVTRCLDARPGDINEGGVGGRTPLMHASMFGHDAIVRLLVARGASTSATDANDLTALSYALGYARASVIDYFIQLDALWLTRPVPHYVSPLGMCIAYYCAVSCLPEETKRLEGAKRNFLNAGDSTERAIRLLLDQGMSPNIEIDGAQIPILSRFERFRDCTHLLHVCCVAGRVDIAHLLVDAGGADLARVDKVSNNIEFRTAVDV